MLTQQATIVKTGRECLHVRDPAVARGAPGAMDVYRAMEREQKGEPRSKMTPKWRAKTNHVLAQRHAQDRERKGRTNIEHETRAGEREEGNTWAGEYVFSRTRLWTYL